MHQVNSCLNKKNCITVRIGRHLGEGRQLDAVSKQISDHAQAFGWREAI